MTRFTADEIAQANAEWGCNCGPGALAAMLDITLADVRRHMGDFEKKGYTNPTLMFSALNSAYVATGARWHRVTPAANFPTYGLARIQWHGPWTAPGVPPRVAYRHTHWVGSQHAERGIGIFDINAMGNGTGWCSFEDWNASLVPWILRECEPGADGRWSITHAIEINR